MSEKLTRIRIPGQSYRLGLLEWGEKTPAEMIRSLRAHAQSQKEDAEMILSIADALFQVDVVRGPQVQHKIKTLQESSK